MSNIETDQEETQGVGYAAYSYFTDAEGLVFETAIPDSRSGVDEFLAAEAEHDGISPEEVRARILQRGYSHYVLDALRTGAVNVTEAANLLGVHYHDFYRMAYSSGALEMPAGLLNSLLGKADGALELARAAGDVQVVEISYAASMEALSPLFAEIAYVPTRLGAPVLILQHGDYPGSRLGAVPAIAELARQGFFAVAVSKRGRDGSAGPGDSWCRETMDILDALHHCQREYAMYLDPDNVNIMGQSGGGMDTIACVVRFPDTFRCAVDIAGTLDVAGLIRFVGNETAIENAGVGAETYAVANREFFELLSRDMGGAPDAVPDRARARDVSQCGVNNPYTRTFFVWDEEDGGVALYTPGTERYLRDQVRYGYVNSEKIVSTVGDPIRFFHWVHDDQTIVRHRFIPQMLSGTFPAPVLSPAGRMVIPGFVRTKRFTVWLGQGDDAAARLDYRLTATGGRFSFRRLSSDPTARGSLILYRPGLPEEVREFGLDETVVI